MITLSKSSIQFVQIRGVHFQVLEDFIKISSNNSIQKNTVGYRDRIVLYLGEVYFLRTLDNDGLIYEILSLEDFKLWMQERIETKWRKKDEKESLQNYSKIVEDCMISHSRELKIRDIIDPKLEDLLYLAC